MVGLGKMGANMTRRLIAKGHEVVAFDLDAQARKAVELDGATTVSGLPALIAELSAPRVVWVMVPSGPATQATLENLSLLAEPGDVVIDGGNSNFAEAAAHGALLERNGIHMLDAGTSGGVWGLENGYCLMVGGSPKAVAVAEPIFLALAPEGGYAHVGPLGAGHFVKMVHNGIEYGLMEAYAEGFDLLSNAEEYDLDLAEIASIWNHGSVVRSWLLELTQAALSPGAGFEDIAPYVVDSGEGRWTLQTALERQVPTPAIAAALIRRYESRDNDSYALRLLAALRNQFGGHDVVHSSRSQDA
jgi:6-phosphogluconate dehydrogenase